jgi:hypothetical protein
MPASLLQGSGFGRRLFPRLSIDGTLLVRDVTIGVTMSVEDLSAGGFRTISPLPLHTGTRHAFDVVQPGAPALRLVARVVHCSGVLRGQGPYAIGWAFERDFGTSANVVRLLDYVTDATSFAPEAGEPSQSGRP